MKRKANIRLSLSNKNAVYIFMLLRNVIAKITGNLFFPNPPYSSAELTRKEAELSSAIDAATEGSKADRIKRNRIAAEAADMLRAIADYQRMVSNGDEEKLATGGFELARIPEPIERIGIPKGEKALSTDKAGQIEFRFNKVRGAHYYNVFRAEQDPAGGDAKWTLVLTTTRARNVFSDLESFKPYWFCVSAVGVNGEGLKSDIALGRAA